MIGLSRDNYVVNQGISVEPGLKNNVIHMHAI